MMIIILRLSLLMSCAGTSYPSSVAVDPIRSPASSNSDPSQLFFLPEKWQFQDYGAPIEDQRNQNFKFESNSNQNIIDVMHADQPAPPDGHPGYQLRYPQSQPCVTRKKIKKSILFGTPPSFKMTKERMQTFEVGYYGHRLELKCPFKKGCPKATALWYKDGIEVKRGTEEARRPSRVFISRGGESLTIEDNRVTDDGNYTCVIRNIFGSIQHTVKVKSIPRHVAAR